ncbi:MAG: hypothetical protein K0R89_263 [Ramlibacter sp.]|jgi:uncharacterized Zn finger protein (UPF0148 family)|nr:hypothetical protein [Ramlibacter sp.]
MIGMRGCDSCTTLVYAQDVFCPTCGAGVQEVQTAAGKVRIPMRRHGVLPVLDEPEMELLEEEARDQAHAARAWRWRLPWLRPVRRRR